MNIPYSWSDLSWDEDDLNNAREDIEAIYNALKRFDDDWNGIPVCLRDALNSLGSIMRFYEQHDKETERKRLEEWQSWAQSEVSHVH